MTRKNPSSPQALDDALASGKKFSDYVGFHVRIFFCLQIAWFLMAPEIIGYINARNQGLVYTPDYSYSNYLVAALLALYGAVLTSHIAKTLRHYVIYSPPSYI